MKYLRFLFVSLCAAFGMTACSDEESAREDARFSVSQTELSFTGYSSTHAVKVDANRPWTAVPSDYWISVNPDHYPSDGTHFVANVAVTVTDNDSGEEREGVVTFFIGDESVAQVTVHQDKQHEEDRPEEEFPITWANLQWAVSTVIAEGTKLEAGCCVFANGITNAMESATGEDIVCQIGYATDNSRPDGSEWVWFDCPFHSDWGDNFYYQGYIEEELPAGIYYYTFRVRNGQGAWKYAGTNGLWDGTDNVNGSFEVKSSSPEEPDYSGLVISWANAQWFATDVVERGQVFEAGSCVYIEGLTDLEESAVDGMGVVGQIGYSASPDPHGEDWIWTDGWWNGDWGNNFYYQGKTPEINESGTYYWTFRFKMGKSGEWVYAGADGLWDGAGNNCKTFTVR